MDGNPYSRLVAAMREIPGRSQGGTGLHIRLGTVQSCTPLVVRTAGIDLPASALKINERLTAGSKTKQKIVTATSVLDNAEVTQLSLDLEEGDRVLLLTEDDQMFYIVMKVVSAA